jgi:DNA-binding MarR family transcriptional regulator
MPLKPNTPLNLVPMPGLLEAAAEAVFAEFRVELEKEGYGDVRPTHGCVFRFVHGDGMRLTEIAGLAGMTKQSVGEVVDDLSGLGYLERIPDPADKRAKLICLTDKGEQAQEVGYRLFGEIEARWAERFGAERVEGMRELLEEVVASLHPEAVPELAKA